MVIVVAAQGVSMMRSYYLDISRSGAHVTWSDAQRELAKTLQQQSSSTVYVNDWGIAEPLRLWTAGQLKVGTGTGAFWGAAKGQVDREEVAKRLREPQALHVRYASGITMLPPCAELVEEVAASLDCHRETVSVIRGRIGDPTFEIYRFSACK